MTDQQPWRPTTTSCSPRDYLKMYGTGKRPTKQQVWKNEKNGDARRFFTGSYRISSSAVWSVIFQSWYFDFHFPIHHDAE